MSSPLNFSHEDHALLAEIERLAGNPLALYQSWARREVNQRSDSSVYTCALGQKLLDSGEPLLAFDVLRHAIVIGVADVRTQQLCALSLLRSGSVVSALNILEALFESGSRDEETIGLFARAHKSQAFSSSNRLIRDYHLAQAFKLYQSAFELTGGYWTGINAATLALVLQDCAKAEELARKVENDCRAILSPGTDNKHLFWPTATLAEAALILGHLDIAAEYYLRAARLGRGRYGDIASMRRNAKLILEQKQQTFSVDGVLQLPRVFCFTGHMVDLSGSAIRRLPAEDLETISGHIKLALGEDPSICYGSAACGSDILFLEANEANGGDNYIVLPFPAEQFIEHSVRIGGEYWVERFQRQIAAARNVYVLGSESTVSNEFYFRHASQMALGFARLKARELDAELRGLSVWDGAPNPHSGGTGVAVQDWRASGIKVDVITPPSSASVLRIPDVRGHGKHGTAFTPEIRAMLFGDVAGFSKLRESQMPAFVAEFLALVGEVKTAMTNWIQLANTWGDGIYMVFRRAEHAGVFALALRDRVVEKDWGAVGLPGDLSLRIGLHAGPVYACIDPVTLRPTVIGKNVVRTARIEPITPPGGIYTSQEFAALAAFENSDQFRCEYVGKIPAAKAYGEYPTFCLFPKDS